MAAPFQPISIGMKSWIFGWREEVSNVETGVSTREARGLALEGERISPDFREIPLSWRLPCPLGFALQSVEVGPFLSKELESSGYEAGKMFQV